ncbi:hypothetical protein [Lederbergia lenta]|nr:hypothetical protein [Lederbergia lenta]
MTLLSTVLTILKLIFLGIALSAIWFVYCLVTDWVKEMLNKWF